VTQRGNLATPQVRTSLNGALTTDLLSLSPINNIKANQEFSPDLVQFRELGPRAAGPDAFGVAEKRLSSPPLILCQPERRCCFPNNADVAGLSTDARFPQRTLGSDWEATSGVSAALAQLTRQPPPQGQWEAF